MVDLTLPSAARTRLVRFAWIAAKLAGRPGRAIPEFFRREVDPALDLSDDVIEAEIKGVRSSNVRRSEQSEPRASAPIIRTDWLHIDEAALGLRKSLIRIPNDGLPIDGLMQALRQMPGIRQVVQTAEDHEILAVRSVRSDEEEQELRAQIREHTPPSMSVRMHRILAEHNDPAIATWLHIAQREARAARGEMQ